MSVALGIILIRLVMGQSLPAGLRPEAQARPVASDEVVVAMQSGHGAGRYHFRTTPGDPCSPRYFAVGPDGSIYVLDSDQGGVHGFTRDGTLKGFVDLNIHEQWIGIGPIGPLAAAEDGTLYVVYAGQGYEAIGQADWGSGLKLLLGEAGAIPREQWKRAMDSSPRPLSPYNGPRPFGGIDTLYVRGDGLLTVIGHSVTESQRRAFLYEPTSGRVSASPSIEPFEATRKTFDSSVKGMAQHAETVGGKTKRDWSQARKREMFLAMDGCLYYMTLYPDSLEIHRVRFQDTLDPPQ